MSNLKIGDKIRAKRRECNMTQEELANKLFVSKAAVSKWENEESYPDITMLPQIAQIFHITMDELFDYTLEEKPLSIVNEYHFEFSLDVVDRQILNYGIAEECKAYKVGDTWEICVDFVSNEENFPYILQKYIKPGVLIDGYSLRRADGKVIDDDKPNKHYICSEKVWEYNLSNKKYMWAMLREQADMGLIEREECF